MTTTAGNSAAKRSEAGIWLIVLGALALILGLIGFFMTFALTLVSTLWYGALLAAMGVAHIVFGVREKSARWLNLLLGAVYLLAGLVILANPVGAALTLTLLIGVTLCVLGVARVVWSCPSSEVLGQWGFGFSGGLGSSGVDI